MKMTVMPIVTGALGLIKGLEDLKIKRQVETIQTTANSRGKPSANAGVKNSQRNNNNNNNN